MLSASPFIATSRKSIGHTLLDRSLFGVCDSLTSCVSLCRLNTIIVFHTHTHFVCVEWGIQTTCEVKTVVKSMVIAIISYSVVVLNFWLLFFLPRGSG